MLNFYNKDYVFVCKSKYFEPSLGFWYKKYNRVVLFSNSLMKHNKVTLDYMQIKKKKIIIQIKTQIQIIINLKILKTIIWI